LDMLIQGENIFIQMPKIITIQSTKYISKYRVKIQFVMANLCSTCVRSCVVTCSVTD